MDDEPLKELPGDFLTGDVPGNDAVMAGNDEREEDQSQRPLQLPRVGWGTEDDADDPNNAHHPIELIPELKNDESDGSVVSRALSRNTEGELAPIPEDISMHGTWPDYYPDILGCYDYDHDRKKYQYRGCGPTIKRRLCAVFIIVFAAIVGSKVSSETPGKRHEQPQPSSPNGDSDGAPLSLGGNVDTTKNQPDAKKQYPPGVDVYEAIVDTLQPMMFDDSTQWDGSFFDAFEFCGTVYNRIPCPYVAYCPLGPGHAPLGGTKIDLKKSWAPIFNSVGVGDAQHPDWVQLGSDDTCELYSRLYGHQPPWSNAADGEEPKGISRHVMCCLESVDGMYRGGQEGPSNDPNFLDRPPSLEEDELQKPIPIREEEGDRTLRTKPRDRRRTKHNKLSGENNSYDRGRRMWSSSFWVR